MSVTLYAADKYTYRALWSLWSKTDRQYVGLAATLMREDLP